MTPPDQGERVERVARVLAEHVAAVIVRRPNEPVDVCRFHRELAEDILASLASDERQGDV